MSVATLDSITQVFCLHTTHPHLMLAQGHASVSIIGTVAHCANDVPGQRRATCLLVREKKNGAHIEIR